MDRPRRRRLSRCFSLLEIMIVVIIIGMILGLIGPNMIRKFVRAQQQNAKNQIMMLRNAVKDYYLDNSEYPARLEDLIVDTGSDKWDGPYLDPPRLPEDPWGEQFHYENPGQHDEFDILSYGADRSPGGDGKDADITSWE